MGYQYYGYDLEYYMVVIPIVLLSFFISQRLKYKMTKYSKQNLSSAMTGKEIAEKMLNDNQTKKYLNNKKPKKVIIVKGRIINIVV